MVVLEEGGGGGRFVRFRRRIFREGVGEEE